MNLMKDIIGSVWMMSQTQATSLLPLLNAFLKGEANSLSNLVTNSVPYGLTSSDASVEQSHRVLVIPIHGVIMKYDYCGDMGMMSFERLILSAADDESIGAVVLDIDSGGGQATYLDHVSKALNYLVSKKPLLTHFSSCCCSAAYYIASASTKIYASSPLDTVGSIGTMMSLYKDNPQSTDAYVLVDLYSRLSTEKNLKYRQFEEGNNEPYLDNLDQFSQSFHNDVRSNRPAVKEAAFTGIDVLANSAEELGLIDGIKRLSDVIEEAFSLIK